MDKPLNNRADVTRPLLLALLAFGLAGNLTELVLLEHYEGGAQWVPLVLGGCALVAVGLQFVAGSLGTVRVLRVVMTLLVLAGMAGVVLHYRGNLAFQVDMDPTLSQWQYFKKIIHAKAPPLLAPGAMVLLGLIGLIYSYKHPALEARSS